MQQAVNETSESHTADAVEELIQMPGPLHNARISPSSTIIPVNTVKKFRIKAFDKQLQKNKIHLQIIFKRACTL